MARGRAKGGGGEGFRSSAFHTVFVFICCQVP